MDTQAVLNQITSKCNDEHAGVMTLQPLENPSSAAPRGVPASRGVKAAKLPASRALETIIPTTSPSGKHQKPAKTNTRKGESTTNNLHNTEHARQRRQQQQHHARQRQNRVGKRYRDRLGTEFANLHAALRMGTEDDEGHAEQVALSEEDNNNESRKRARPMNKTEVVELARERVVALVRDCEAVRAERDALLRERALEGW